MKPLLIASTLLLLAGCTSYGKIVNEPRATTEETAGSYSIKEYISTHDYGGLAMQLAFSGGGTRAAALAYGVLQELRDTKVLIDGHPRRLLDEVDLISSVSGGSFTSAYYGLHGDRIFEDFESAFLRRNVQHELIDRLLNPFRWFGSTGRTEMAIQLYERSIFHGATFADMRRGVTDPLILINASDLGYGVRFSFVQEFFNLLCSDISTFPVSRAVTASSAVPVLFNPVVLQNHPDCKQGQPEWLTKAMVHSNENPELREVVRGLATYYDADQRKYAHFVDGGITDNLGLRAIYEVIEVAGGIQNMSVHYGDRPLPSHVAYISVDASTEPEPEMDLSNEQPSLSDTINAVSGVQLHRYNAATLELMKTSLVGWTGKLSTPDKTVEPHFISVGFSDLDPAEQPFFNEVPTSFALSDEQVDRLISAGRQMLRNNPEFRRLLKQIEAG